MDIKWSLDALYPSFESNEFQEDLKRLESKINNLKDFSEKELKAADKAPEKIQKYIELQIELTNIAERLSSFSELTSAADSRNSAAQKYIDIIEDKLTEITEPEVKFEKWLALVPDFESIFADSKLKEHEFYLKEILDNSKYLLSDKEEIILSKLRNTGSGAFERLHDKLTSDHMVKYTDSDGEKMLPLSVIRNMAYDGDMDVRKRAYEAEITSYSAIADVSAACLNSIKGESITLSKLRGYESPLAMTLNESRMSSEILDSMIMAINEYLPVFRKYLKKKAEILGHKNGLPFYDIFAPVGEGDMKFTYEEAKEFIIENFRSFSSRLSDFAALAFKNNWIDVTPREGKQGGAFCSDIHSIGESRILTNFTGSLSDVTTIAHELGHGYHNYCMKDESPLNIDCPMPLAETASIFCETIILNASVEKADRNAISTILENDIQGGLQVIVDIMSRFIFESEVINRRPEGSLSSEELCEIMLDAQKATYGDGLDENFMHKYMWVCKSHYYISGMDFYNFPYAFGFLFGKGLYAEYLKGKESFVKAYDRLLIETGKNSVKEVALTMGIKVDSPDFWRSSLKIVSDTIDKWIALN